MPCQRSGGHWTLTTRFILVYTPHHIHTHTYIRTHTHTAGTGAKMLLIHNRDDASHGRYLLFPMRIYVICPHINKTCIETLQNASIMHGGAAISPRGPLHCNFHYQNGSRHIYDGQLFKVITLNEDVQQLYRAHLFYSFSGNLCWRNEELRNNNM